MKILGPWGGFVAKVEVMMPNTETRHAWTPKVPKIMAQYSKIESIAGIGVHYFGYVGGPVLHIWVPRTLMEVRGGSVRTGHALRLSGALRIQRLVFEGFGPKDRITDHII